MSLIRVIIMVCIYLPPTIFFKRKLRAAFAANDMKTFAAWRRWRAIGSLVFWSLIGVWLFLRPQYRDWRHQFAIVVLVYVLIDSILELKWSASPDANRRYGAKLKNEW